jgi:hypothetical protein
MRKPPPRSSGLLIHRWLVPKLGVARVSTASLETAKAIDTSWPSARQESDVHLAWRWAEIIPDMNDAFVVLVEDEPIGVWASKLRSPVLLEGRKYYRLDYVEIAPRRRGDQLVAPLVFGLIAKRAAEVEAIGVVLAAFQIPALVDRYVALGASEGCPRGWNHPPELVPLMFEQAARDRLRGLIDGLQEDSSGSLP